MTKATGWPVADTPEPDKVGDGPGCADGAEDGAAVAGEDGRWGLEDGMHRGWMAAG